MKTDKAKEDFVDINYLRIADKESLILIKSEAEKTLEGLLQIEDSLTDKSNNLIKIAISIFAFSSGYLIQSTEILKDNRPLFFVLICISLLMIVIIILLYGGIYPRISSINGARPKDLLNDHYIKNDKKDFVRIIGNRVYSLQHSIQIMEEKCNDKSRMFGTSLLILLVGLITIFILGAGVSLISNNY